MLVWANTIAEIIIATWEMIIIINPSQLHKQLSPPRRWLLSCHYQIHHNCTNNTIIATQEMIITISFNLSEYSVVPIFVPNAQFSSRTEPEACQYLHCSWVHHRLNCINCCSSHHIAHHLCHLFALVKYLWTKEHDQGLKSRISIKGQDHGSFIWPIISIYCSNIDNFILNNKDKDQGSGIKMREQG